MRFLTIEIVLAIATLLGAGSAIFFWGKLTPFFGAKNSNDNKTSNSILSLPDEEFSLFEKILSFPENNIYTPTSEYENNLCNSLVNHGWLIKTGKASFKLTNDAKNNMPNK